MSVRRSDELLSEDLDTLGLHDLAARARRSEWNDYFGLSATPQHALVQTVATDSRLTREQRDAFIRDVIDGKYDGTQAEAEEWISTDEGAESLKAVFRGGIPD